MHLTCIFYKYFNSTHKQLSDPEDEPWLFKLSPSSMTGSHMPCEAWIALAQYHWAREEICASPVRFWNDPWNCKQAPEIIMRKGTGIEADYWALGILIFEMLVGDPPFKSLSGDPWDTFRRTLSGRFFVPPNISSAAADLIYKLLQVSLPRNFIGLYWN